MDYGRWIYHTYNNMSDIKDKKEKHITYNDIQIMCISILTFDSNIYMCVHLNRKFGFSPNFNSRTRDTSLYRKR